MAKFMLNDKNEDHKQDRLEVIDSVIELLKLERNYNAIEVLGSGTYGDVFKVFNSESKTTFAAKIVTHKMIREAESLLWTTLDHPNIVPLTEFVDLSIVKAVVYIMPIQVTSLGATMSDKEFRLKGDALDQVNMWLRQTLCGLEYLHSRNLAHLDIKEDNVLISHSSTAMICDFTCLNDANKPISSAKVGSPSMYKPPEAFYKEGTVEGKPCDLWAFGIMAIEMLADFFLSKNLPPIEHNWLMDVHPTLHEILNEKTFKTYFDVTFPKVEKNAEKDYRMALDFIHGFLKMDPSERSTAIESTQHPFLNGGSDVVNTTDDIWNDSLYMGASEFDEDEFGFSNEDDSNEGSDFFNMALEDFDTSANENGKIVETQILESRHSSVVTQRAPNSEFVKRLHHSSSETFKNNSVTDSYSGINNLKFMVDVISLGEPKESKTATYYQRNPTKFLSEDIFTDIKYGLEVPELGYETSQMTPKVTVFSETTLAFKSTNKFATGHEIPLSEKIRNLRLRIKQLIENSGSIKEEKILKAQPIADEFYFQMEDVGLESKDKKEFHEGLENNSKGCEEDFATRSKPTSLETTLESVVSIKSPIKNQDDYEETNFEFFDVSSKEGQEEILKINLVGQNSAEANLSADFTRTPLKTPGRRKRFIGWIQSKFVRALLFCCTCTTLKNSSKKV